MVGLLRVSLTSVPNEVRKWASLTCARFASLLCDSWSRASSRPWRKVLLHKRPRKGCWQFRLAPKVMFAIVRSAQREIKNIQDQTQPYGFFGANTIPTGWGWRRTWLRACSA